jgi:hypothetical protein
MTGRTGITAFAGALSALVDEHDVGDVLTGLVQSCAAIYPAAAVAILVRDGGNGLELLSATSHESSQLELLQIQHDSGPCVDSISADHAVLVDDPDSMVERWGEIGSAISRAGFRAVHAYPLHWRGSAIGGLNIFLASESPRAADAAVLGQMFADLATLVVVRATDVPTAHISARVHAAVVARATVEQAKGVLAYQHGVDMPDAYKRLSEAAEQDGSTISETARRVISRAQVGDAD